MSLAATSTTVPAHKLSTWHQYHPAIVLRDGVGWRGQALVVS